MSQVSEGLVPIVTRTYLGKRVETDEALAALSEESQAGLRQYSIERMMGYGVDYSEAVELRARILSGETWSDAANAMVATALAHVEGAPHSAGDETRVAYLRRASALMRLGQTMMLTDTPARRAIFARAADLYARAADISGDRTRVLIDTPTGKLAGWLIAARAEVASTIVIGGVEGWAMDFDCMGEALAARGVTALMLDGPGQGESRLSHGHYLSPAWREAYRGAVDFLAERAPGQPIGFIGNSLGGSFAMTVAAEDRRIRACCNNGGPIAPGMAPQQGTFFSKMMAVCNSSSPQQTAEIFGSVTPAAVGPNSGYPLLMVHGGLDPMISMQIADLLFQNAPTPDRQMVVFSDGDHCIYRHKQDRDVLVADWMRARLTGVARPQQPEREGAIS